MNVSIFGEVEPHVIKRRILPLKRSPEIRLTNRRVEVHPIANFATRRSKPVPVPVPVTATVKIVSNPKNLRIDFFYIYSKGDYVIGNVSQS